MNEEIEFEVLGSEGVVTDTLTPNQSKIVEYLESMPDNRVMTSMRLASEIGVTKKTIWELPPSLKKKHSCKYKKGNAYVWGGAETIEKYRQRFPR